jgi:hypothetical protein
MVPKAWAAVSPYWPVVFKVMEAARERWRYVNGAAWLIICKR